ncbi:Leucine-rich repeat typical subtype [Penicillium atrosanguineum]|uniref:Leucine-rich repeat typical subtype n=1 Tax=Penicillium atrosanguineum TaxID=1132637 RepID=A0A9W9U9B5_9EURO|nr:Leucine-rich repeat typical subtype [Penicillium atrosanguineum]KAJ5324543.1 Leucine-rich repeat typical subtype [Penicillium atrosanguineum]
MTSNLIGQRRSFDGQLCTVRYVGSVQGTVGDWLGVEWDDASRGKHSGEHKGLRYFTCRSKQPTAGSFVRPSRPSEPPRSFLEALREKYASEPAQENAEADSATPKHSIKISSKVVEEVGFDKIRREMAELQELRIVILDGLRLAGVLSSYEQPHDKVQESAREVAATCPKITDLDLSRNLLSHWRDVWEICNQLKHLRRLKVNGNRFQSLEEGLVFKGITELHLEETFLSWDEITEVASRFPMLTSLTLTTNELKATTRPLPNSITTLTLEWNEITSLSSIRHLSSLPNLEHLSLRGNNITTITDDPNSTLDFQFPQTVHSVDLSLNKVSSWTFLNHLSALFPGLTTLRLSRNPLYEQAPLPTAIAAATSSMSASRPMTVDEAFMLTLSRFPTTLRTLNFSKISWQDRSNAEMYYLSLIGKTLSATSEEEEPSILAEHPRYAELCELYGEPTITRAVVSDGSGKRVIHPRSVAARLVKMAFRLSGSDGPVQVKEIPGCFNSYQVKALVDKLFGLPPFGFKLVWETDEWDPVEKDVGEEDAGWDGDSDDEAAVANVDPISENKSRFVRREVELVESTRDIGFMFQGETGEMKIRVDVYPV